MNTSPIEYTRKGPGHITLIPAGGTAGYYSMDNKGPSTIRFALHLKPDFFRRFMVRFLLGWKWTDDPQPTQFKMIRERPIATLPDSFFKDKELQK